MSNLYQLRKSPAGTLETVRKEKIVSRGGAGVKINWDTRRGDTSVSINGGGVESGKNKTSTRRAGYVSGGAAVNDGRKRRGGSGEVSSKEK